MKPSLSVAITLRAAAEIQEADAWWREHRAGAPGAIVEELRRALALLIAHPAIGTPAKSPRLRSVRRLLLPRIGYFLYYRIRPRLRRIDVIALWHTRRGTDSAERLD